MTRFLLGLGYLFAQVLGGFVGGMVAWIIYEDPLKRRFQAGFEEEIGSAFAPIPYDYTDYSRLILLPMAAGAVLLIIIFGIADRKNLEIPRTFYAFTIGMIAYPTVLIAFSTGWNNLIIINPTVDIGLRVFVNAIEGEPEWLKALCSWVGVCVGALIGGCLYFFFFAFREANYTGTLSKRPFGPPLGSYSKEADRATRF